MSQSTSCTRCTMQVKLSPDGKFGICDTCSSWFCPQCRKFSLQMSQNCLECGAPRPKKSSSTTTTPPPPPRPQQVPSNNNHNYNNYNNNLAATAPTIFQGVLVNNNNSNPRNRQQTASMSPIPRYSVSPVPQNISSESFNIDTSNNNNNNNNNNNRSLVEVNRIRENCRQSNSVFVDCFNPEEFKKLEWGSVVPIPGENGGEPMLRSKSNDKKWIIFPQEGPRPNHPAQQQLGTCWFLSAASVLAGVRPDLIESLFPVREVNPEGVFAVRLWTVGKFETICVDGNFPICNKRKSSSNSFFGFGANNNNNSYVADFKYAASSDNICLWPSLLEKALAKLYNSYESISAGTCQEAFYTLTGFPSKVFHFGEKEFDEKEIKTPDEIFQVLHSFSSSSCVMGASCGGRKQNVSRGGGVMISRDEVAQSYKLRSSHAYAVLRCEVCSVTKRKMIKLRDPWNTTSCCVGEEPPVIAGENNSNNTKEKLGSGEFWMQFDMFLTSFSNVTACLTRPFTQRLLPPLPALCTPESSFMPRNFAEGTIMFQANETCQIHAMVCQPEIRVNVARPETSNGAYFDLGLFLLKLPKFNNNDNNNNNNNNNSSANIPTLFAVAGSRNLRVNWFECVCDPGTYILIPFSFQQHKASNKEMSCCLLHEKSQTSLVPLSFPNPDLINYVFATSNRWFYSWMASQTACSIKHATQSAPWTTSQLSLGESRVIAVASFGSRDTAIAVDCTSNQGVVHPGREDTAGNTNLVIPAGHAAIIYWSVSMPYGMYNFNNGNGRDLVISNGASWQMREVTNPSAKRNLNETTSGFESMFRNFFGGGGHNNNNLSRTGTTSGRIQDSRSLPDELGEGFDTVPILMKPFRIV